MLQKSTNTERSSQEFCKKCGCSFPPRYGEGTCTVWQECLMIQAMAAAKKKNETVEK